MLKLRSGTVLTLMAGIILVLGFLSACANRSTSNTTTQTGPITIGYTVPRTGDWSGDGPLLERGYQLWVSIVNKQGGLLGRQVKLIGSDDGSKPDQVTTDYQSLITSDHVNLLFAPFAGDLTVPAAIVAQRYGYVMVEGAATETSTYQHGLTNLFAVSLPVEHYVVSFAQYIRGLPQAQLGQLKAAYVTSQDTFTQPQVIAARTLLEGGGVQTTVYKTYTAETTNYAPLAASIVNSHAQVVVLGTTGVVDLSAFIKYFRLQHYNPQALIATTGPDQGASFTSAIGGSNVAEGIFVPNDGWYPGIKTYQNAQFQQAYSARYGGTPADISSDTVQGFAAAQVLQQAVNATHSIDNQTLIQYLRSHTFDSLQGKVQFDAAGRNIVATAFLFQWQKGALIPVYPSAQALAPPEFPKPNWP